MVAGPESSEGSAGVDVPDAFLTRLVPQLEWLRQLGAMDTSFPFSAWPLHVASLGFLTAWQSRGSMYSGFFCGG